MNEQIIYIRKSKYYSSYSHGDKSCRYLVADLVIPGHKVFLRMNYISRWQNYAIFQSLNVTWSQRIDDTCNLLHYKLIDKMAKMIIGEVYRYPRKYERNYVALYKVFFKIYNFRF